MASVSTLLVDEPFERILARRFHETYERLAPYFGYETRRESAVAWEDVPENNRALMEETCRLLVGTIRDHCVSEMKRALDEHQAREPEAVPPTEGTGR